MGFLSWVYLAVGVSVFLLGMQFIRYFLENNFKRKSEYLLKRFTSNRFNGTLTGALVTFAMQSSSVASVLTATLADRGYISLYRAFWIIVGANIGTTFTGLITAADFSGIASSLCVIGIVLISFFKKKRAVYCGILLSGLGLLFLGLRLMEDSAAEIKNSVFFINALSRCSSPLSGILTGAFFTSLIQSSSGVTALLQTLAYDNIIDIRQAFFIILGSNIGTCATCLIASFSLSKSAKAVSFMHILYNLIGSLLFLCISFFVPIPEITKRLCYGNIKIQIAVINIFFNLSCAALALLLPIKEKADNFDKIKTDCLTA